MNGYAPVHHGELYYEVSGEGQPLVLLHAGIADHTMWDAHAPVLAQRFRVIRYDARGYGRSRSQDTDYSDWQDLRDLLDYLQTPAAHVIGISRGGVTAIDFALQHPERVTALVIVAGGVSGWDYPEGEQEPVEAAAIEPMIAAEAAGDWERLTELETALWVDGQAQPHGRAPAHVRERVHRWIQDGYARTDGKTTRIPLDPPAVGRLHEIRVPTLIILGDLDTSSILRMADVMVDGIQGARKIVFPGIAHMLPLEIPDEFNQAVMTFLP